jgi:hypothetical protein
MTATRELQQASLVQLLHDQLHFDVRQSIERCDRHWRSLSICGGCSGIGRSSDSGGSGWLRRWGRAGDIGGRSRGGRSILTALAGCSARHIRA